MNRLTIPEYLYGREKEIATLFESFERISKGVGEILTVPGTSGVGKTTLVQQLEAPVKKENGFFVSGKFEQFQQNMVGKWALRAKRGRAQHFILISPTRLLNQKNS